MNRRRIILKQHAAQCAALIGALLIAPYGLGNPKSIELTDDCREVGNSEVYANSAYNQFGVGFSALSSLGYKINPSTGNFDLPEQVRANFKSHVISEPMHGKIIQTDENAKHFIYSYQETEGYIGKDSFVIGVDTLTRSGQKIHFNMKYLLSVVEAITNDDQRSTCVGMKFKAVSRNQ
jgi:hypothetical protein